MRATTTQRRFKFVGSKSDKFWNVSVSGNEVVAQYGRNGTNGQSNTKTFADNADAEKYAEKLIRSKLAKGYSEVM